MRRLSKNLLYIIVSQGAAVATGVLLLALSAHYLGPALFGQYAVLRAIIGVSLPLVAGGLRVNMVREIGRDPAGAAEYLGNVLTLRWAMSLLTTVAAIIVVRALPLTPALELAGYAAILSAISILWEAIARSIFLAYERSEYGLLLSIANALLTVPATLLAIHWDTGIAGILAAGAVTSMATGQAALFFAYRRFVRPTLQVNYTRWREILRVSLPIGFSSMLKQSYDRIDIWLLAALREAAAAGIFNGAYRVIAQVTPLFALVTSGLLPRFSLLAKVAREQFREVFSHLLLLCLVISIPAACLAASLAGPIVSLLLGPKFAASAGALRILSVMLVTSIPNALFYFSLIALGKETTATWCLLVSIAANALFDVILISLMGVRGACFGTVGAEWVFFLSSLAILRRTLQLTTLRRFAGKPFVCGLGLAAPVFLLGPGRPALGLAAGVFVYLLLFALLRPLPRGFLRDLRRALTPPA